MSRGPGKTQRAILDKLEAHLVEHPLLGDFEPNGNLRTTRDGHPLSFLTVAQLAGDDATRSATVSYRRALNTLNRDGHVFLYYGHNRVMGARIIHDTEDEHVWRRKLDDWNAYKDGHDYHHGQLWKAREALATAKRFGDKWDIESAKKREEQATEYNLPRALLRSVQEWIDYELSEGGSLRIAKDGHGATIAEREQAYRDEYNAPPEAENDATPQRMPDEVAALMGAIHEQP